MSKMNKIYAAVLVATFPWLSGCETSGQVYNVPVSPMTAGTPVAEPEKEAPAEDVADSAPGERAGLSCALRWKTCH
jgi:hypothetical protein